MPPIIEIHDLNAPELRLARLTEAQLRSSAQQQGHGVGQQRTKVGHSANAHEDDGRIDAYCTP